MVDPVVGSPGALIRRPDWPARLVAFLEARRRTPFAWGSNCCGSFPILWMAELTGRTVRTIDWSDARGALAAARLAGGMREVFTGMFGEPTSDWRAARRGDVVLALDLAGREVGTVCTGGTLVGPGHDGLVHLPLDRAILVWNVG